MKPEQGIYYRRIQQSGEIIGVSLEAPTIFHFNCDAALLFDLFAQHPDPARVAQWLCEQYSLPEGDALMHAETFHDQLAAAGLLRDGAGSPMSGFMPQAAQAKGMLEDHAAKHQIPVFATLELLTGCHLDCVHCYIPRPQRQVSRKARDGSEQKSLGFQEVIDTLDQLAAAGTIFLKLTGGEIFLRPDIYHILAAAAERGFIIELLTSGTPLTARNISRLPAPSIGKIQLSVYSTNAEVHDAITRQPGSLRRTLAAAHKLIGQGIPVEFACAVMKPNYATHESVQQLAEDIGAGFTFVYPIVPETEGGRNPLEQQVDHDELRTLVKRDIGDLSSLELDGRPLCNAGRSRMAINAQGDLTPCNNLALKIGNIKDVPLSQAWSGSETLEQFRNARRDQLTAGDGTNARAVLMCPGENLAATGDYMSLSKATLDVADAYNSVKERSGN